MQFNMRSNRPYNDDKINKIFDLTQSQFQLDGHHQEYKLGL